MAWTPYVNYDIFTKIDDKTYLLNDGSGTVYTNPLTVQMISYDYDKYQAGTATEKQRETIEELFNYQEPEHLTPRQQQKRGIFGQPPVKQGEGREFIDYQPSLESTNPKDWTYENMYNNFMSQFLDNTNTEIFNILKRAMDSTGLSKIELGKGLQEIPYDALYYLGYSGLESDDAMETFATEVVNHIPNLDSKTKSDIENRIFDSFSGE